MTDLPASIVAELNSLESLVAVGRKYGLAVVATPSGQDMLKSSGVDAAILANICPVETDPWSQERVAR